MIAAAMQHGGQLRTLSRRFGIDPASLLDFSANINPDGPPVPVISALQDALLKPATLGEYPDIEEESLRESLATYAGVTAMSVMVANGFVPILSATLQALRLRRCILPVPAFNEYRKVLAQHGVEVEPVVLQCSGNFHYDFDELVAKSGDAILVANPQNPTGILAGQAELVRFVELCARRDCYVLLDEAFIDYVPQETLSAFVGRFPNLIVFRSLTKFFGVPGLRVAYGLACEALRLRIASYLPPWSISTLASTGAIEAVKDIPYIERAVIQNERRRNQLAVGLEALSLKTMRGRANYLLFQTPNAADLWKKLIFEHGLVLRLCASYESLPDGFLRAAVRNEEDNVLLLSALAKAVSQ
jgi:threonine-phosphate decarboxylase